MRAATGAGDASYGARATTILLSLSVMCVFLLSPMMLSLLGVAYDTVGGAAWQKIHPASYFATLALAANFLARRRLVPRLAGFVANYPGALLFAAMWAAMFVYAAAVQHTPVTALIDTFLVAFAVLILYDDLTPGGREFLRVFLHGVMFANASIGIVEFVAHVRLTPFVAAGMAVPDDYRSTALLGQPLTNAGTTGAYILCLLLGGDRRLSAMARGALLVPQVLAMPAFGGRTAIIMTGAIATMLLARVLAGVMLGRRFDIRVAIAALLGAPLLGLAGVAAIYGGALDNLITRFVDDKGSAKARLLMFRLFDEFPLEDQLFGPRPEQLQSTLTKLGIEIGIENTWLSLMFQYGALMEACFVIGLVGLCFEFWRRSRRGAWMLFVYFIVIVTSATGLASKTLQFCQFSILLLFFMRERRADDAVRAVPREAREARRPPASARINVSATPAPRRRRAS